MKVFGYFSKGFGDGGEGSAFIFSDVFDDVGFGGGSSSGDFGALLANYFDIVGFGAVGFSDGGVVNGIAGGGAGTGDVGTG
ncbi:hypothetical protein AGMMS49936_11520 [Endomicrobiia bacterium]|nr:hypothetical protein AGMMS49936_11520 [Endomicrobiia bacterium]